MKLRKLHLALVAIGLVALPFLGACGGDDDSSKPAPTKAAASSPAAGTSSPVAAAAYPVTVTDLLGRKVEIKAKPKTVVGLSPSAVEFVYAAGGTVVGRTSSVDFPEAAKQAKDVGSAYQPNMEAILALKPDLIVGDSIIAAQPSLRKPLEESGILVIFAGADSYQKVLDGLALMGKVFDAKAATDKLAAEIAKARDDAKAAVAGKTVSALAMLSDQNKVLYGAKTNSYPGDILQQMGINNPAANLPDAGPFPGYTTLAPEKIIEFNPDFIFTISPAPAPAPKLSTTLPQVPPFKGLKALTTPGHLVEAPVELLQAPGPRIIESFKAIAAAVAGAKN